MILKKRTLNALKIIIPELKKQGTRGNLKKRNKEGKGWEKRSGKKPRKQTKANTDPK